jgi:hypothetical protein
MTMLLVRAGSDCEDAPGNLAENRVSTAFDEPDASACATYEDAQALVKMTHPEEPLATVGRWAGSLWNFRNPEHDTAHVVMPVDIDGKRAFAIGRVEGPYQFLPDVRDRHRRKVTWLRTDIPASACAWDLLNRLSLPLTCYRLVTNNAEARLMALAQGAPLGGSPEEAIAQGKPDPTLPPDEPMSPFTGHSFELLGQLQAKPTEDTYTAIKPMLKAQLARPMQELVGLVVRDAPDAIRASMETEDKLLSRFTKNDYGKGGIWPYLWAAIYTKGATRLTGAQLYLFVNHDEVRCGFYIGDNAGGIRQRFRANAMKHRSELLALLRPLYEGTELTYGEDETGRPRQTVLDSWLHAADSLGYRACVIVPKAKAIELPLASWHGLLLRWWNSLYPLAILANLDDPMPAIRDYIQQGRGDGRFVERKVGPAPIDEEDDDGDVPQIDQERAGQLMQAMLKALAQLGGSAKRGDLLAQVPKMMQLSSHELELTSKSKNVRWHAVVTWYSVNCQWLNWITKSDNKWHLTPDGQQALNLPSDEFMRLLQQAKKPGSGSANPPPSRQNPIVSIETMAFETGMVPSTLASWIAATRRKGQAILAGPPGTGKTYCARWLAAHLVGGGDGFVDIVQFHPAYTYEDFIEGIRPKAKDGRLEYPVEPGRFLRFLAEAAKRKGPSVLIIDEINRANLAQVFGELMYLLEYRQGVAGPQAAPATLKLANGGEVAIPSQVVLLGTMNTADRSIALVDHALRRRFAILPLQPEYGILVDCCTQAGRQALGTTLKQVLEEVNRAIDDRNYHIGISYFMGVATAENPLDLLASVWAMEIEHYLDEYFADQPEASRNRFAWAQIASRFTA